MAMPSPAGSALGLIQQVDTESDEQRRKKLIEAQQSRLLPGSAAGRALNGLLTTGYSAAVDG
jgi:hypothetical protein